QRLIRPLRAVTIRARCQQHQPARPPLAEGVVLPHLLDSRLQRYELQPFFGSPTARGVEGKLCLRKSQPQPALWELWTEGPRSCGKTVLGFFHSSGSFHNAFPRRRSVTLARSAQKKSPGSPPWGTGSAPFNFSLRSPIDGHRSKP